MFYKIRHKNNPDQYISGTPTYHSYTKDGRLFTSIGSLRTFLTGVMNNEYRAKSLGDWSIVEVEMRVVGFKELHDVVKPEKLMELLKR